MTELLQSILHAKAGDKDAMAKIVQHYMPLINKYSWYEDLQAKEDCRRFIIVNLIAAIPRFKSMPCNSCENQDSTQH